MSVLRRLGYRFRLTHLRLMAAGILVAAGLVAVTGYEVVAASDTATAALHARDNTASAASRRIDLLGGQIGDLQSQLRDAAGQRAQLDVDVDALTAQVEQMCRGRAGCAPIVTTTLTSAPAGRSTTSTTNAPSPPPTAPPQAPPSSTTTSQPPAPSCQTQILGRCVPLP